jgi:hypothetical protein
VRRRIVDFESVAFNRHHLAHAERCGVVAGSLGAEGH